MAENSRISWTHHTFNPWMGCTKVSTGCAHCYAETLTNGRMGLDVWGDSPRKVTSDANWKKPLTWNRKAIALGERHRVFCASLCDVFEDDPTANEQRPRLFDLIGQTRNLDWLILTKRPERILQCLPSDWSVGWPNVWLGTSIENDELAWRAYELAKVPALCRFISYEPALGPIAHFKDVLDGIDWMIFGGESGPGFRPMKLQWARDVRDLCREKHKAFFFKQIAASKPGTDSELDGQVIHEFPDPFCDR